MKKTSLRTVIVLLMIGVLVLLSGCGGPAETPADDPAVDDGSVSEQPEQDAADEPEEQVYPVEITVLEGTDGLKDGEKLWADKRQYMLAELNLFPQENGYLIYFNMDDDRYYDLSAEIVGETLEINFTRIEDNSEGKYSNKIFARLDFQQEVKEVKGYAYGGKLSQSFAARDVIELNELGAGNVDWSFLKETPEEPLNEQVLEQINKIFSPSIEVAEGANFSASNPNALHCVINSEFSKPEEMDLLMFLRHFPYREEMSEDEKEYLENSDIWLSDRGVDELPYPTTKTSRKKVDEMLKKHLGITVKSLDNGSDISYLKKYDSYYTFFSDYGPGMFNCIKGEKRGDKVYIYGEAGGAGFFDLDDYTGMAKLTLYESGDGYMIEAFEAV